VLPCLQTYDPWLNPVEVLWRQWRCEVTRCEPLANLQALLAANKNLFDRHNRPPGWVLANEIGVRSKATEFD
jgi:putative transposase